MTSSDDPRLQGLDFPTPTTPTPERMRAAAARLERAGHALPAAMAGPLGFTLRQLAHMLRHAADQHEHPSSQCRGCRVEMFADILLGDR